MAKQPPQASLQDEVTQQPLHPVLRNLSQVDELLKAANQRKEQKEFQITELETWKECVNGLAASPHGRMFLKSMLQFSGIFEPASVRDTMKCVDAGIKAAFYMKWVRPFLNQDLRKEIEP